jgi:hypothetical protein
MRVKQFLTRIILVLLFCAGISSSAGAQSTPIQINNLQLLDYGLLNIHMEKAIDKSTTATGKHNVIDDIEFYKQTSDITAQIKDTFGIKYQINGFPEGTIADFTFKVIHPPINGRTMSSAQVKATVGSWRADFYTFEEEFELVEGEWTMQIWDKNRMLLEKAFTVTK